MQKYTSVLFLSAILLCLLTPEQTKAQKIIRKPSDELQALFLPDDMEGTGMILTFTLTKPATEPANQ